MYYFIIHKESATRFDLCQEYDQSFFGLYHGGGSINCCALGQRYYKTVQEEWPENRLAILIDSDARSMQCFCGLQPFGELFAELPKEEPLWPMIVCMACHDSVSISIASVWERRGKRLGWAA